RLGLADAGSKVLDTMNMDRPAPDWVKLAEGMGVSASRAETADEFYAQLKKAIAEPGPHLIEAVL
ncbi:MAG: thiamine pyrophosphate-dependent enzyme, partial [Thermodesulfobacteriota bacterium]